MEITHVPLACYPCTAQGKDTKKTNETFLAQ